MIVGRTSWLACCAAIVTFPFCARAAGYPGTGTLPVTLEYDAVPGCPEVRDFKAVVVGRLGYDPFRESAPDRVLVRIAPRGRAIQGRLEWRDATGRWAGDQTFPSRGGDCGELVRAMGFSLALQIQLLAIASAPPDSSADTTPNPDRPAHAPPPPVPAPPAVTPPSSERRAVPGVTEMAESNRRARPILAIGAGASAGFGLSSSTILLSRLFGTIAWSHLSMELAAELSLPETTRRADGAGFSQQQVLVSVAGCGALQRWSACLLAKAGEIRIVGLAIDVPSSPSGPMFEAGLRLGLTQQLGRRAYVAAHADALANVTRWTVTLDASPVWTAPRFAATAGLDAGVRFP